MSAIDAALGAIDDVARRGRPRPRPPARRSSSRRSPTRSCCPTASGSTRRKLHGEPVDRLACALLDMEHPARSTFLRLIGPPGSGKSQIARAIAHRLWTDRGRAVEKRHGAPFYGFVEITGGPSSTSSCSGTSTCPPPTTPARAARRLGVRAGDAHGWVVMIDEVNTIRDVALLSANAVSTAACRSTCPPRARP